MDIRTVTIYALINPLDFDIFYVGCTTDPQSRLSEHSTNPCRYDTYEIVSKIIFEGKKPEMITLHECDVTEATYWENSYIDFFQSYGFITNQLTRSHYTETFFHKMVRVKRQQITLNIHKEIPEGLEVLAKKLKLDSRILVRMALREFFEKYKHVIDEKDDTIFKETYFPSLSHKIKKSHDHYFWDVNTHHS